MQQTTLENILKRLWPQPEITAQRRVFAVLDGARDARIAPMLQASRLPHNCLYYEPLTNALRAAAPYVIELAVDDGFTHQLLEQGWGQSWGIFLITVPQMTLTRVCHNCRRIIVVQHPSGQRLLFRYYDPRVLRIYFPTCTADEIKTVFGSVNEIIMEGEQANLLQRYKYDSHGIKSDILEV